MTEEKYKRLTKYVVVRLDNNTVAPFLYASKEKAQDVAEKLTKENQVLDIQYRARTASIVFKMGE